MKNQKKKSFAILLVLLFSVMLLQPLNLKVKAVESSVPKYLDYTKGYTGFALQWKNKSFLVVQDNTRPNTSQGPDPTNLKFIAVENGKESIITTDNKYMPSKFNFYYVYNGELYFQVYGVPNSKIYKYNLSTLQLSLVQEINAASNSFKAPKYSGDFEKVFMGPNGKIKYVSKYSDMDTNIYTNMNNGYPDFYKVIKDGDKETGVGPFSFPAERPEFYKSYDIYNYIVDDKDNTWFSVKKIYDVATPKGLASDAYDTLINSRAKLLQTLEKDETLHQDVFIYKIDNNQNVIKIDAKELTYYDGYISYLEIDKQGNIWVSGHYRNYKTNVFQTFIAKAELAQDNTLKVVQKFNTSTANPAPMLLDSNGIPWVLDNGNIKKYENGNLVTKYIVYNDYHNDKFTLYDDNNFIVYGDAGYKVIGANVPESTTSATPGKFTTAIDNNMKSAVLTLDSAQVAKNGANEITPVLSADIHSVEAKLDAATINGGTGSLKMNANNVTVELPFVAVDYDGTAQGSYVSLKQNIIANDPILSGVKDIGKVFDFNLGTYKQDGTKIKDIHNFKSGKAKITVKLTNEDVKNLDTTKLGAFYYNEETKMWELIGGTFDKNAMTFTFETPHFSKYTIAQINGTLPQTGAFLNNNDLIIAALVLIALGVVLFVKKPRIE